MPRTFLAPLSHVVGISWWALGLSCMIRQRHILAASICSTDWLISTDIPSFRSMKHPIYGDNFPNSITLHQSSIHTPVAGYAHAPSYLPVVHSAYHYLVDLRTPLVELCPSCGREKFQFFCVPLTLVCPSHHPDAWKAFGSWG
jgi:hypothetical protein